MLRILGILSALFLSHLPLPISCLSNDSDWSRLFL